MKISPAIVYTTGHFLNERMSLALSMGFKARRKPACARVVTDSGHEFVPVSPEEGFCSMAYGILRGTGHIFKACESKDLDYLYCDHSFFGATRSGGTTSSGHYRLVPNGRYYTHLGNMAHDRWKALGIEVQPWRKTGSHIVLVPVSKFVAAYHGFDSHDWIAKMISEIKRYSSRPLVVKPKDSDKPLSEILKDAWALVTMDSNAAIDAAISGIPVFTSPDAAAAPFGLSNLARMESPAMPDRTQHLANLAYQQWTAEEIRTGKAARVLQEQIDQWDGMVHAAAVPRASGVLTVSTAA